MLKKQLLSLHKILHRIRTHLASKNRRLLTTHYSLLTNKGRRLLTTHYSLLTNKGFTLVESLVAISIILIAVAGPLTIVSKNLAYARFARDQITAFYLAQEAVEFVRNTRDNNVKAGKNWLKGLNDCSRGKVCTIDSAANEVRRCSMDLCDPLKLSSSGIYGYLTGTDTIFTREVSIQEIVNNREATLDITVRWTGGPLQRNFTIREHILNWQ